jgi:hypothetical protein
MPTIYHAVYTKSTPVKAIPASPGPLWIALERPVILLSEFQDLLELILAVTPAAHQDHLTIPLLLNDLALLVQDLEVSYFMATNLVKLWKFQASLVMEDSSFMVGMRSRDYSSPC